METTPTSFYFPYDVNLFLGSAKRKADTNLAVIELVKEIEKEGRFATPDEQELISHYVGYGDSSVLSARYSDVVEAVTNEEFAALRASTLNAHYTSLPIIRGIWAGLLRMGAGKLSVLRVLDPSAGIGHFQSASPECIRTITRWVEIELDKLTAHILKSLHPNIEGKNVVFNDAFENVRLLENQFDLVISNVPFGNYPVVDRAIKESGLKKNIHDYFFVKALSLVKPNGIIAFITSRYTLDKKNSSIREYLAKRAELLAAVRLPDTAFVANAGTQVVTDIIILRKRPQLLEGQDMPSWVNTYMVDGAREYQYETEDDTVDRLRENCIYYEHPEWIVGARSTKRGMYTRDEYTIKYDGEKEIGEVVAEILTKALPEDAMLEGHVEVSKEMDAVVEMVPPAHVIEIKQNLPVDHVRRLEGLRSIYDAARRLLDLETKGVTGLPVTIQRDTLNKVYDTFVMRYGPITNKLHQRLLENSPALPFLLALENDYSPLTNSAQKALIFTESTVRSAPSTEGIQNCTDALLYCLNQCGTVDIDMIADLAHVTVDEALAKLGERVLWTPAGGLALSDVYLSGNIAEKLEKARAVVTIEPKLKVTVDALIKAMPKPLKPGQIRARLGSGWIPARYVAQFIEELLPGVTMQVTYIPKLGTWTVTHKRGYMPAENSSKYGTKRYTGLELIEAGLNAQTPVVYDTVEDEQGNEKRILNQQETIAAQAKLEELKTRFDTWLWSDDARAVHLAELYNARFNVFVRPHSDGSHLTLPGLSKLLIPRPLQKDAVWFSLQRAATLVGDEVGLGKTLTAIIAVMEAIRLGSAHKSLLVVPNHLTEQWRDAFLLAYPNANVLCAGKDDLSKSKRREFMSRIATGRWDAVIVPQSSFKMLPVKPDTLNKFVEEELEELRDFLQRIKAEKEVDNRARKQIEKAIKRFEAKLINKSEMDKDSTDTITWDEMGIDMLVVDEFHCLPYEARVLTDRGLIPIGEIVEKRLPVRVKSVDLSTQQVKWMPVTGWFNNPQSAPMVQIKHENGTLECTANHKIWTYEEGYVEAGKLMKEHTLKNLPSLQEGVYFRSTRESWTKANPLLPDMLEESRTQNRNKALRTVRKGVHLPVIRQEEQQQETVLRNFLCSGVENGTARAQGIDERIYAPHVGGISGSPQGQTQPCSVGADDGKQPYSQSRMEKKNVRANVWQNIPCQGWERQIDSAAGSCSERAWAADGVCDSDQLSEGAIQVPAQLLQGGHCRPSAETGDRDRWADAQYEEVEVPGQTEDRGVERSRVFSVTFLESESGFRPGGGSQRNKRVYCLEVAETHNFFADGVLVSNCYKNLFFHTKMTRIAGLPNTDSQRAFDMFVKVRDLMQRGGRFMGLTGTPISNTMAETFTLQRYFSYDQLVEMGLSHFDSWAQMFADVVMMPEMTPDGSGFRVNTRLARFSNIPELSAMLSQFMILRRFKDVDGQVDRPNLYGDKPTAVKIPGSRQLKEYVKILAERAEEIRGGQVDPRDDNMLKVVGDGRKAALDLRLAIPGMSDIALSKINISTQNIAAIYHHTGERKSAQIVFCDLGTPKPHKDSVVMKDSDESENTPAQETEEEVVFFKNVYADIKAKLIQLGVHPSEIAFIHDAKGPTERSQLFAAVREGRIRVLIGSTEKMGTGMNVQTRALAMHHLDAPWRPADLEQREGRLVRQGNMYPEVFSFVYIVEGSFDGYVWQILETKAKFIEQFLTGQTDVREMDDIGETVLSMAEIKALASGNPKIMERVMAQNEIMKLEQLRLSWQNERRNSQRQLASRREELEQTNIRIRNLGIGAQVRDSHTSDQFSMKVDGKEFAERKLAGQQLIEMARAVKLDAERTGKESRKSAGSYRGFVMWLRAKPNSERCMSDLVEDPNGGVDIILDYNVPQVLVAHVSDSDTGTVASVDAAIRSIDGEIKKSTDRRDFLLREIDTLEALLKDPWEKAEKLEALCARLAELDQELIKAGIDLRKDEAKDSGGNGVEEIHVEEEVVPKAEQVLDFDINVILRRIDEIHSTMTLPVYAEEELIALPTITPDAILVTPESVAQLESQAESAALMAGFTRSILAGSSDQMSLDDFLEMPVKPAAPRKGMSKSQKKVAAGQLTLF
jgi:N12 class adenine-specific DNA methylase